jgi:hypothetical protein
MNNTTIVWVGMEVHFLQKLGGQLIEHVSPQQLMRLIVKTERKTS